MSTSENPERPYVPERLYACHLVGGGFLADDVIDVVVLASHETDGPVAEYVLASTVFSTALRAIETETTALRRERDAAVEHAAAFAEVSRIVGISYEADGRPAVPGPTDVVLGEVREILVAANQSRELKSERDALRRERDALRLVVDAVEALAAALEDPKQLPRVVVTCDYCDQYGASTRDQIAELLRDVLAAAKGVG